MTESENRCTLSPDCTWPEHDAAEHPCGKRHIPGAPCDYCGDPTPLDGSPCPKCWISLDGMATADIKALFAAGAPDLNLTPRAVGEGPDQ